MNITLDIHGDKQLKTRLKEGADALEDFTPAWEQIQTDFYDVERNLFASSGASGEHGEWRPLVPWYFEYKKSLGKGEQTLVFNGNMYSSLTSKNDSNNIPGTGTLDPKELHLGTKDPKAVKHYKGVGVPVRRPIDLDGKTKTRWMKWIHEFVNRVLKMRKATE